MSRFDDLNAILNRVLANQEEAYAELSVKVQEQDTLIAQLKEELKAAETVPVTTLEILNVLESKSQQLKDIIQQAVDVVVEVPGEVAELPVEEPPV